MLKISDNAEIEQSNVGHSIINELANKSLSTLDQERFIIFPPLLKNSADLDRIIAYLGRLMVKLGLVI